MGFFLIFVFEWCFLGCGFFNGLSVCLFVGYLWESFIGLFDCSFWCVGVGLCVCFIFVYGLV